MLQGANTLDWTPTVMGVGVLGLPEEAATARWMIAHLAVIGGATALKAGIALAFIGLTRAALQVQRRGWIGIALIGFVSVIGVATGALAQTVLGNRAAIGTVLSGSVAR